MDLFFKELYYDIEIENFEQKIFLYFFGDVHRDTRSCDTERWQWFRKKSAEDLKRNEKTYFIGMGDYNDFASGSEQVEMKNSKLHDNTRDAVDLLVQSNNRLFAKEVYYMSPNLIGLLDGNHNWVFKDGSNATQDLAKRLNTEWFGWLCHLTIKVYIKQRDEYRNIYLVLCHGKAGGKTAGITLNQVDDLTKIFPIADIYVMGHDHQRGAWPKSVIYPEFNTPRYTLKQKRQFLCRSGSFMKSYTPNESNYTVARLYKPADLGALKLQVGFHRETKNENYKRISDRLITDIEAII